MWINEIDKRTSRCAGASTRGKVTLSAAVARDQQTALAGNEWQASRVNVNSWAMRSNRPVRRGDMEDNVTMKSKANGSEERNEKKVNTRIVEV